jgi:hypothetical protein
LSHHSCSIEDLLTSGIWGLITCPVPTFPIQARLNTCLATVRAEPDMLKVADHALATALARNRSSSDKNGAWLCKV